VARLADAILLDCSECSCLSTFSCLPCMAPSTIYAC
jgi:hypothetical protein